MVKTGDRVKFVKGCDYWHLSKGISAVVEIEELGKEYGYSVRIRLKILTGKRAGLVFAFYARHINRLSDPIVRLHDGNPLHNILIQLD